MLARSAISRRPWHFLRPSRWPRHRRGLPFEETLRARRREPGDFPVAGQDRAETHRRPGCGNRPVETLPARPRHPAQATGTAGRLSKARPPLQNALEEASSPFWKTLALRQHFVSSREKTLALPEPPFQGRDPEPRAVPS